MARKRVIEAPSQDSFFSNVEALDTRFFVRRGTTGAYRFRSLRNILAEKV